MYWWEPYIRTPRVKFIKQLIQLYSNEKTRH